MKAVIYARVSSREQEETGYSLPAQEKLLREYAERKGFEVVKVFSISESASGKRQRQIFNEMLSFVKKNDIKIILCEKVDRLTRNLKDAVLIDEWLEKDAERQVHLVKDSLILHKNSRSQEKLNWGIRVILAKNYIENLSEEIKKGQMEKISQGWLPGVPPLGYKLVGSEGHKIPVIDEEKAPLIRKMFELYATGNYSLEKLVEVMWKEGLRTKKGNKLCKSRMASLLSHPFYYGKIMWNGKLYEGKHQSIISKELFDRVQKVLNGKTTPKYRKHLWLFKGLIRCRACNRLITWEKHKGIIYGHCSQYRKCSQKTWIKESEIESQILEALSNLEISNKRLMEWVHKALKDSHRDEIAYREACLNKLKRSREMILNRLDRLYDDKLDGKISEEFYEKKLKQYSKEKEEIESAIERHERANLKYYELGLNLYELSQRAKEIYLKAKLEEKRQLIKLVFKELLLNRNNLAFTYTKPFELISKAVKETNGSKIKISLKISSEKFEPAKMNSKTGVRAPVYPVWRRVWDNFRTLKWIEEIECPELIIKQVEELLQAHD
jgi:DNA invertase Pin-like site-specific DNA recombinase